MSPRDLSGAPSKVWVDAAEFTDDLKVGCEVWLQKEDDVKNVWLGGYDVFGVGETEGVYIYILNTYIYIFFEYVYIYTSIFIYLYICCINNNDMMVYMNEWQ